MRLWGGFVLSVCGLHSVYLLAPIILSDFQGCCHRYWAFPLRVDLRCCTTQPAFPVRSLQLLAPQWSASDITALF